MIKFSKKKPDQYNYNLILGETNKTVIDNLQEVLHHNAELLNTNNFVELYKIIRNSELGEYGVSALTDVLTQAKIDPLIYMDEIPDKCFQYCDDLISIDMPNNIKSIGYYAFSDCPNLTDIIIPNSVTSIGYGAFYNCWKLTNVVIPNGVTAIEVNTFYNCGRLKSVAIPNSVISIGQSAFEDCRGLTNITIPDSVTFIGGKAFKGCLKLTNITIPDNVTLIDSYAFEQCHSLTNVIIPDSVVDIGDTIFMHCKRLTSVTIPANVKSVAMFSDCNALENITYKGTKLQWHDILNGNSLVGVAKNCVIHCSDGDIELK